MTSRSYRYWRVEISSGSAPDIGVIYFGATMTMENPIYGGHAPVTLSKKTVIRPQKSEGGQWLGRSIIRQAAQTGIKFNNISASFMRSTFEAFMNDAISNPFFFAWRATSYPDEVAYCWTGADIVASNTGQGDKMSVSFNVDALLE